MKRRYLSPQKPWARDGGTYFSGARPRFSIRRPRGDEGGGMLYIREKNPTSCLFLQLFSELLLTADAADVGEQFFRVILSK